VNGVARQVELPFDVRRGKADLRSSITPGLPLYKGDLVELVDLDVLDKDGVRFGAIGVPPGTRDPILTSSLIYVIDSTSPIRFSRGGDTRLKLRDHGNEIVVGLVMLYCLERDLETERFMRYQPVLATMLDRILASANPDGMLYNVIDPKTLKPIDERLSDNWGYIYGAVYAFYQATGEAKYRDAVLKVLKNLPKYRNHAWEPSGNAADKSKGSFDGYADAIESAIYLVNREPVAEAIEWIDSEMQVMQAMQRPDGHVEDWYGEGNFNRTSLLYALMQSQGVWADGWRKGVGIGAVKQGTGVRVYLSGAARVKFDYARHRRVMNFRHNYVRLNEFPEWFTVEENLLYRVSKADGSGGFERLGAELVEGIELQPGLWTVEPAK